MKYFVWFFLCILLNSCSYLPENGSIGDIPKKEHSDYNIYYSSELLPEKAFLFIPGGLVDPHVYSCWINELTLQDTSIAVILLKFPSNLAIANMNKVMKVAKELEEFDYWVVGGHSLGGIVATTIVHENADFFDGLILLASWSREATNLSQWSGSVFSVYASEDLLSTPQEILENVDYLPKEAHISTPEDFFSLSSATYYYEILGGNHSGFGCYGKQSGDGNATIEMTEQQEILVLFLESYFKSLW